MWGGVFGVEFMLKWVVAVPPAPKVHEMHSIFVFVGVDIDRVWMREVCICICLYC